MDVAHARRHTTHVIDAVAEELYGVETVIKLSLAALLSGGHVLLEGNPGLGKTELVKRLARVMNLKAGRIQFTPDLMPADITGTLMPTGNGGLRFQSGPIFTSLLLADEINRATPKTQSAMLEAMAEKKVTVLGEEHTLPSPFVVLATQNPIDHEGTYNLPAAQADRFMFKVRMPVPDGPTLKRIVHKRAGAGAPDPQSESATAPEGRSPSKLAATAEPAAYDLPGDARAAESLVREISQVIRTIAPLPAVEAHVTNLFLATNRSFAGLTHPSGTRADIEAASRRIQYGMSPRAAGDIMLAAKAWVCLSDTDVQYVAASHLQAVVVHALRHRLRLSLDDDHGDVDSDPELRLDDVIRRLCLLTAPKDSGYDALWQRYYA
jgi:MoxR-like ATPase